MKTDIKKGVILLLFTAVCGMIYNFLLPSGNISKTAKKIISLLMLFAVCMPIFGVIGSFKDVDMSVVFGGIDDRETFAPYDHYIESVKATISRECDAVIKKYTNVPHEITVDVNICDDGSILIEHVRIVFDARPEGKDGITDGLKDLLGMMPDIRVDGINE